ncbi:MAG TPA: YncE family protein [Armatimonadota bacterium]|jgi:YVTN family beta-propeller protein
MRKRLLLLALLALGGVAAALWLHPRRQPLPPRLYVVNALSRDLSVIDAAGDTEIRRLPLDASAYRIALAPRGDLAYITTAPGVLPGETPAALLLCDLRKDEVTARIPLPDLAPLASVHVSPRGSRVYVVTAARPGRRNLERGRVLVVDTWRKRLVKTISIGLNPLDSAMTPDGATLFTADWSSCALSVIDLRTERLVDTIPLGGSAPRALAMRADGAKLYVALERFPAAWPSQQTPSSLLEVDTRTHAVTPIPLPALSTVTALALAPDGNELYAYGRVTIPVSSWNLPQQMNEQLNARVRQTAPVMRGDAYHLVRINLRKRETEQEYGDFGYLSAMTFSPDGGKLYLIGTAGSSVQLAQRTDDYHLRNRLALNSATATAPLDDDSVRAIDTLRQQAKTVTVLDPRTGDTRKTIPIGNLPQGYALTGK